MEVGSYLVFAKTFLMITIFIMVIVIIMSMSIKADPSIVFLVICGILLIAAVTLLFVNNSKAEEVRAEIKENYGFTIDEATSKNIINGKSGDSFTRCFVKEEGDDMRMYGIFYQILDGKLNFYIEKADGIFMLLEARGT